MKVSFQNDTSRKEFVEFNYQAFPNRAGFNDKLTDFRYYNPLHPGDFVRNNIIAFNDVNHIVGQALYHPTRYFYRNELLSAEWGFDFFVNPESRNDTPGIHILEYAKEHKQTLFAAGVGEKALKIHKAFGYIVIGHVRKYFKLAHPLLLPLAILRKKYSRQDAFPKVVRKGTQSFEKLTFDNIPIIQNPYNSDMIEFERSNEFFKWRFFSKDFSYAVYKLSASLDKQPIYFAVRTTKIKGIACLILVDYRYDTNQPADFKLILKAVSSVALAMWLPIIVSGSSNRTTDGQLEMSGFKATGKDRPIVSNRKDFKTHSEKIKARNFVFLTLADSDGEYSL